MGREGKNWWPANHSKPEIWLAEPERLRTSRLMKKRYIDERYIFTDLTLVHPFAFGLRSKYNTINRLGFNRLKYLEVEKRGCK